MATHTIELESILTESEISGLDKAGASWTADENVDAFKKHLSDNFALDLATDPDIVSGYAQDSSNLPGKAIGVARPSNVRQAAAVMRLCRASSLPVTISSGRTNLTGSATAHGGIVLGTEKLSSPEVEVDIEARTVLTNPAIILEDMRGIVWEKSENKLTFPVDPTSRKEATVGGALCCNASGFTPGEVGAIRCWVDKLKVLLPSGCVFTAGRGEYISKSGEFVLKGPEGETAWPLPGYPRPSIKNAGGPWSDPSGAMDLVDLIIGSEGIFGLILEARLRLIPQPPAYFDLFISLPTEEDALKLQRQIIADTDGRPGEHLSAMEYFGIHCRKYMKHADRFFHNRDEVAIYIQQPVAEEDEEECAEIWLDRIERSGAAVDEEGILLLDTKQFRDLFLEARHSMPANALEVVQHRGTFTIMTDASLPHDRFAEFLAFTHDHLEAGGLEYLSFGHLGDSHLHFTILPHADQVEKGVAAYDAIIARAAELGGIYSGEHGTGKRKRRDFLLCYGEQAVEAVRKCKAAVDPGMLLNRDNVIEMSGTSAGL